ncbi:hypothetical protein HK102_000216 [Quaeritorhiza haematococci]|nr:hypothetical protein HK102_000216 [Quaeritorhiza haematococci]
MATLKLRVRAGPAQGPDDVPHPPSAVPPSPPPSPEPERKASQDLIADNLADSSFAWQIVPVNAHEPVRIESKYFSGYLTVHVRNFSGVVPANDGEPISSSEYFTNKTRNFSVQVQGRFKKVWSGDDVMFGAVFDNPITPPTGSWLALRLIRMIDPGIQEDLYGPKPWLLSPLLCAMNTVNAQKPNVPVQKASEIQSRNSTDSNTSTESFQSCNSGSSKDVAGIDSVRSSLDSSTGSFFSVKEHVGSVIEGSDDGNESDVPVDLSPWFFKGSAVSEDTREAFHASERYFSSKKGKLGLVSPSVTYPKTLTRSAMSTEKRRKYFSSQTHRQEFVFNPDTEYAFEFFSPAVDFNTFHLRLGMSLNFKSYLSPPNLMATGSHPKPTNNDSPDAEQDEKTRKQHMLGRISRGMPAQPVRFVAQSRTGEVFFAVEFDLVPSSEEPCVG